MLDNKPLTSEDLLNDLNPEQRQKLEALKDRFKDFMKNLAGKVATGDQNVDVDSIETLVDRFMEYVEDVGGAQGIYSLPDFLEETASDMMGELNQLQSSGKNISKDNLERARELASSLSKVAENLKKYLNSDEFKSSLVDSLDVSKLSPGEWRKLVEKVMDMNMQKGVGGESGSGIASLLAMKIIMSPQFKFMLKEYLRDLRVAPGMRESYHQIGKYIDARRTFMESSRTGLPLLVFKKKVVKPRTREDIILFYDVSGSMENMFAFIMVLSETLSDLGLNVKVWYGDVDAIKAVSRDFIEELKHFGGGGTRLSVGLRKIIKEEDLSHAVVIMYSDLEVGVSDYDEIVDAMEDIKFRGSYPAVFVVDCKEVSDYVDGLRKKDIFVKCDVNTPRKFIEGLKELKPYIKRVAVIR